MIHHFDLMRVLKYAYFLSIALILPIQMPPLPGNTTIFDFVNAAFMGIFVVYFLVNRTLEVRLALPWLVILVASLISMINSADVGLNLLTLVQELYLYSFFIALSSIVRDEREMRIFAGLWFLGAAVYSIPLIRELAANFTGRAQGTFSDDNGAAAYLGAVAFAVYFPFSKAWRAIKPVCLGLILAGVFATKSLSGLISYLAGTVAIFVWYWRFLGARARVRLTAIGIVVALLLAVGIWEASHLHNYLDRFSGSESGRRSLWTAGLRSFVHNPLGIGIGPARFKDAVIVPEWSYRKELHSDYLSFLAERGILGFVGLLMIFGSIAKSLSRTMRSHTSQRELLWILALMAMFIFTLVDAVSHEMLHNRHVWVIYALIVAQERITTNQKRRLSEREPVVLDHDEVRPVSRSLRPI